ncbi:MAG: HIT domain-containing protein [Acidobacteria bacterium]|nr:HIT domain-containing protein [Acidobacteriota bacterium]
MDYLWTPWRFHYVTAAGQADQKCIFCHAVSENRDRELLVVHRAQNCLLMLNRFPYNSGHVMLAPYRHIALLEEATAAELHELIELSARCQKALRETYAAQGFNVGMNLGRCAGAGVAGHIHLHLLPRWPGDTNFLTVIGEARVLPEDLDVTFQKLAEHF